MPFEWFKDKYERVNDWRLPYIATLCVVFHPMLNKKLNHLLLDDMLRSLSDKLGTNVLKSNHVAADIKNTIIGLNKPVMNGYKMFFKEKHEELRVEGKRVTAAEIGACWRQLSEEDKQLFNQKAQDENQKRRELIAKNSPGDNSEDSGAVLAQKARRPAIGLDIFMNVAYPLVRYRFPGLDSQAHLRTKKIWTLMTVEQREFWQKLCIKMAALDSPNSSLRRIAYHEFARSYDLGDLDFSERLRRASSKWECFSKEFKDIFTLEFCARKIAASLFDLSPSFSLKDSLFHHVTSHHNTIQASFPSWNLAEKYVLIDKLLEREKRNVCVDVFNALPPAVTYFTPELGSTVRTTPFALFAKSYGVELKTALEKWAEMSQEERKEWSDKYNMELAAYQKKANTYINFVAFWFPITDCTKLKTEAKSGFDAFWRDLSKTKPITQVEASELWGKLTREDKQQYLDSRGFPSRNVFMARWKEQNMTKEGAAGLWEQIHPFKRVRYQQSAGELCSNELNGDLILRNVFQYYCWLYVAEEKQKFQAMSIALSEKGRVDMNLLWKHRKGWSTQEALTAAYEEWDAARKNIDELVARYEAEIKA